jgi:uncharacterized protein (TIGR02246 family)
MHSVATGLRSSQRRHAVRNRLAALIVLMILGAVPIMGQAAGRSAVEQVLTDFAVAFNAKDAAKVASLYADDAVVLPQGVPMMKGRSAIQVTINALVARGIVRFNPPSEVDVRGDWAVAIGTYTASNPAAGGSSPQVVAAKCLTVFKRIGNDWKIVYDMQNLDPAPKVALAMDANAQQIVALERAALDRWGKGDPGGFLDVYDDDIRYFDPVTAARIDGHDAMVQYYGPWAGKIHVLRYDMLNPDVVIDGNLALLTYNLVNYVSNNAGGESVGTCWNSTTVYQRRDGTWRAVHSHWSFTRHPAFQNMAPEETEAPLL